MPDAPFGHAPAARRILVTGATSGIGAATAARLAAAGDRVLALGRRQERLADLAARTGCEVLVADVRDLATLAPAITAFEPDVLINNAGAGHGIDGLEAAEPDTVQLAFDVNVVALLHLTAAVLPGMRARGRGHVVNVGSIAGLHNSVSAIYGGTKAAVHQITQNLRLELQGSGLRVTEICPGRVATEFYAAATGDAATLARMGRSGIVELTPDDVAAAIQYALDAPSHVNVATIELLPTEQAVGGVNAVPTRA